MSYFNGFAMKSDDWPLMNIGGLDDVFCKGTANTVQMMKGKKNLTNIDGRPCFRETVSEVPRAPMLSFNSSWWPWPPPVPHTH